MYTLENWKRGKIQGESEKDGKGDRGKTKSKKKRKKCFMSEEMALLVGLTHHSNNI